MNVNLGGFSIWRLIGVSRFKSRISRAIGIPLTKSGRRRKIGAFIFRLFGFWLNNVAAGLCPALPTRIWSDLQRVLDAQLRSYITAQMMTGVDTTNRKRSDRNSENQPAVGW